MSDTYSTDGPICPYCKEEHTPDEGYYYDEMMTEFECGFCGEEFNIQVYTRTSWTCSAKEQHRNDDA